MACTLVSTAHATGTFRDREDPAVIREWNLLAEGVIPASAGPTQPRTYAMMHIAMFDAVNSIEGGYTQYRVRIPATRFASSEAAAAQAAHDVLVELWPANTEKFDTALNARLAGIHPFRAQLGAQVGREVAKRILEWRTNDGWATPAELHAAGDPGHLAADTAGALAGHASCRLAMPGPSRCPLLITTCRAARPSSTARNTRMPSTRSRPSAAPPARCALTSRRCRPSSGPASATRSNWGGIWNQVTRFMALSSNLSLIESARLFALVNVSMQDGVQTAQASKFVFQLWRPVHAIQRAAEDMNPATDADPTWMPLLTTPPYPSYAGNMACIGASTARALALYFGTNDILVARSGPARTASTTWRAGFPGFWQMAEHQGASREYGGIHYHFDTTASQEVCPKVAGYVYANFMRPKRD